VGGAFLLKEILQGGLIGPAVRWIRPMFKGKLMPIPQSYLAQRPSLAMWTIRLPASSTSFLRPREDRAFRTQQLYCLKQSGAAPPLPTDRIRQHLLLLSVRSRRVPNQRRRWSRHITVRKRLQKGHNVTLVLGRKPQIPDQSGYIFRHFRRRPTIHFLAR
jgi:hypothetical protein